LLFIQNGYAFNSKLFDAVEGRPLIRIRDLKNGYETETKFKGDFDVKYLVNAGDLLIGMDGEFGCYEWKGKQALLNQRVCKLEQFSSRLWPKFLYYGLNSYLKDIEDVTSFTTVKHISSKQIASVKFPIPTLPEQKRIVTILDQTFDVIAMAVANAEKNVANARDLFESYLQEIFARRAKGWAEKPLSAVCKRITVGHVGSMADRYKMEGIPFLRSQNIRPFDISMENVTYIDDVFDKELKKSQLHPGDLAIVRTGYPGTAAVIPPWLSKANCSDLVIIRPSDEVNPYYLEAFFNSTFGKRLVLGKLVGAAQKHFNVTAAKEAMLHYPPASEQTSIVAEIKQLRAKTGQLGAVYHKKIAKLLEMKKAILRKAFSGELTVSSVEVAREAAE
jgi:type I restriction enzyme S subunit